MIVEAPFGLFSFGGLVTVGCSVDASVLVGASIVSSVGKVIARRCSGSCVIGIFSLVLSSVVRELGGFKSDLNSSSILTDSTIKVIIYRHLFFLNQFVKLI